MGRTFPELADESPDALFALSLDGVILSWNQGVAETFGYSAAEAIGQKLDDLVIPEDRRAEAGRKMAAAIDGAATRFETTRRHKNGSSVTVDVAMRLIRPPDGERYLAVSNKNVTERKLLEEKLRETSRHKGEFLANMSHELRTPLNAIIGFTELMYSGNAGPIAPLHREYLGDVLRSAKHLLRVVNDVLDLARVESGTLEYRPEPVEMGQLVDEVRDVLRGLATRKNLTIEAYVDPEAARRDRRGADPPGPLQLPLERDQVHAGRWNDLREDRAHGDAGGVSPRCRGFRNRDLRGQRAEPVRRVPATRCQRHQKTRGHRSGTRADEADRRRASRPGHGEEHARQGQYVLRDLAAQTEVTITRA